MKFGSYRSAKTAVAMGLCCLAFAILFFQIFRLSRENEALKAAELRRHDTALRGQSEARDFIRNLESIRRIIEQGNPSSTDRIRRVTNFVHENSVHLIDEEHERFYGARLEKSLPEVIGKMLIAGQGDPEERPHLTCGLRSFAMRSILRQVGISSRLVHIFSDAHEQIRGHRLLEVFHPDKSQWEVWDPDYGVTYVDSGTGLPVNIMDLVFGDLERITPRSSNEEGWEETGTAHLRDEYFKAVHFESYVLGRGMIGSVIIVNRDRFDLDKVFAGGLTFEEYAMKHFEHPRIIVMDASRSQISGLPHG